MKTAVDAVFVGKERQLIVSVGVKRHHGGEKVVGALLKGDYHRSSQLLGRFHDGNID